MDTIINLLQKCFIFEKEPQRIGLCQLKKTVAKQPKAKATVKNKEIKLSDLMRRAS